MNRHLVTRVPYVIPTKPGRCPPPAPTAQDRLREFYVKWSSQPGNAWKWKWCRQ